MSTTKISHRGYEHQVTESVVNTSILESILVCPQDTKDGLVDVHQCAYLPSIYDDNQKALVCISR